jgi:hypothetical protein
MEKETNNYIPVLLNFILGILILIFFIYFTQVSQDIEKLRNDMIQLPENDLTGTYDIIKNNYYLELEQGEIASKIIKIGKPIKGCSFKARFSNHSNNSWCSVGLINKGNYKYAAFEKRYGIGFRAMAFNKYQFVNTIGSVNKEYSSDYKLDWFYNLTGDWNYYSIIIKEDRIDYYINNDYFPVATIYNNIPKGEQLFFHIQLSNLENSIPLENNIYVEVKDIELEGFYEI